MCSLDEIKFFRFTDATRPNLDLNRGDLITLHMTQEKTGITEDFSGTVLRVNKYPSSTTINLDVAIDGQNFKGELNINHTYPEFDGLKLVYDNSFQPTSTQR